MSRFIGTKGCLIDADRVIAACVVCRGIEGLTPVTHHVEYTFDAMSGGEPFILVRNCATQEEAESELAKLASTSPLKQSKPI